MTSTLPSGGAGSPGAPGEVCGRWFTFDAEWFLRRGWRLPRRCRACRAQARAERVQRQGTIVSSGKKFQIIADTTGTEFLLVPPLAFLEVGAAVRFTVQPGAPPAGLRGKAFDVVLA